MSFAAQGHQCQGRETNEFTQQNSRESSERWDREGDSTATGVTQSDETSNRSARTRAMKGRNGVLLHDRHGGERGG